MLARVAPVYAGSTFTAPPSVVRIIQIHLITQAPQHSDLQIRMYKLERFLPLT